MNKLFQHLTSGVFLISLLACARPTPAAINGRLRLLATTSIVADVVSQVGRDAIDLYTLMPAGTDPHSFQSRPQDATALVDAQIIFANGAGLEAFLQPLLQSSAATGKLVEVSAGNPLLTLPGADQTGTDPHTWMDPNNVILWTQNIAAALSTADQANAAEYQANAQAYTASLRQLDAWILSEVAKIPPQNRLLVADHAVLGYFAARYGFTQAGSLTGSFSSEAAPSAQELAALEDLIRQSGLRALFVSEAVNQAFADQVAADTGIKSVWIYHASLTASDGPAPNYLEFMRYNVSAIVAALK